MNIVRRLNATKQQQERIAKHFPTAEGKPLDLSTVSNYLNDKWKNQKALEIREYATKILGCKWQTTITEDE